MAILGTQVVMAGTLAEAIAQQKYTKAELRRFRRGEWQAVDAETNQRRSVLVKEFAAKDREMVAAAYAEFNAVKKTGDRQKIHEARKIRTEKIAKERKALQDELTARKKLLAQERLDRRKKIAVRYRVQYGLQ